MQEQLRKLLHEYKVNAFKVSHETRSAEEIAKECMTISREALSNAYHYHFHKWNETDRAEIINMINNYTMEALLPPIVEKLVRRQVILEKKQEMTVQLLERALEILSGNGHLTAQGAAAHR